MDQERVGARLSLAAAQLGQRGLLRAARWVDEAAEATGEFDDIHIETVPHRTRLAKLYFDGHEYERCFHYLKGAEDPVGIFLRLFSRYHAGERRREDAQPADLFAKVEQMPSNPYLIQILQELNDLDSNEKLDPFLRYLRGIVLRQQRREEEARSDLTQSLRDFRWNWSAWAELLQIVGGVQTEIDAVLSQFPSNDAVARLFRVSAYQELYRSRDTVAKDLDNLRLQFPLPFAWLDIQEALLAFHDLDHERGFELFEAVLKRDPHRLDELDSFTNELYVTQRRAKLAYVAQLAAATDRNRAESCCAIANYYSLVGKHEMALSYYRRALVVNRNYMPAWTLMGHEYIELQNTHAAIESYRTAVDLSPRDFRAWYGLGQAYEVLGMYSYAQYYYQRTLALQPADVRVWQALANLFELQHREAEAMQAYKQALRLLGSDSYVSYRLGVLASRLGETSGAQRYMLAAAEAIESSQEGEGSEIAAEPSDAAAESAARAKLWLAQYAAEKGDYAPAKSYASSIVDRPPGTQAGAAIADEARKLLRTLLFK